MRVIIAGSRNFDDYPLLCTVCDEQLTPGDIIICGKARGADTLGERYAVTRGFPVKYYPADWGRHGRGAGYIRNVEMAKNADRLIAFWDGQSRGTQHMIDTAGKYGLSVLIIPQGRGGSCCHP